MTVRPAFGSRKSRHSLVRKGSSMRLLFRLLLPLMWLGTSGVPAFAAPSPLALGCQVQHVPRAMPGRTDPNGYAVRVSDTLAYALPAGTAIQYGITFSDGTKQNGTASLSAPVGAGERESIAGIETNVAPESCSAVAGASVAPGNGRVWGPPVTRSPKPGTHPF
jgi:hypothetical protein